MTTRDKLAHEPETQVIVYECGICSCYHPWDWDGDCRDDDNRIVDLEPLEAAFGINNVIVRSWEERMAADGND